MTDDIRALQQDPGLMWAPWMAHHFHLQRSDMVRENISLREFLAMWDGVNEGAD